MTEDDKPEEDKDIQHGKPRTRRSFLNILWWIAGVSALLEITAVAVSFLTGRKERKTGEKSLLIDAGQAENFALNSVTANIQGRFYLCRLEDGGFLALSGKCTHLGCSIPWMNEDKKFACPCHGSAYDIRGVVLSPPATRPLDIYPVIIQNGLVRVDVAKGKRRDKFHMEQVVYAKRDSK